MRRLALLLGIIGAAYGLFLGCTKVQIMWRAHVQHTRFASLANNTEVQKTESTAIEEFRNRDPHRYYLRWKRYQVNDPERKIEAILMDGATETISGVSLTNGEHIRDDTDRPFYAYLVIVVYPAIGFAITWLSVRSIGWVLAGFSKQK